MKPHLVLLLAVISVLGVSCKTHNFEPNLGKKTFGKSDPVPHGFRRTGVEYSGVASWYEIKCNGGTHTASGETLDDWADTAAHKTLPMGTHVVVTNLDNGAQKVVRINDRGPYIHGRIIDVTKGVAHDLGFAGRGIVNVKVEVLESRKDDASDSVSNAKLRSFLRADRKI